MGKLIRDLIPELFPGTATRSLAGEELSAALRRKLVEEAVEALRADDDGLLDELADVLEVLRAILAHQGHSWPALEAAASRKASARGAFQRSIFAEELEDGLDLDLLNSPEIPLAPSLIDAFENRRIDEIDLAVSFLMDGGLTILEPSLVTAAERGARIRILATDYLGITSKSALRRLLHRQGDHLHVRLFRDPRTSYHPKAYLFASSRTQHPAFGFVGSSNLSHSALQDGVEWTVRTTDRHSVDRMRRAYEELWEDPRSTPLTPELVESYIEVQRDRVSKALAETVEAPQQPVSPTELQQDVLRLLAETRLNGFGAGLVVLATGLGKTWLAAFDSARPEFRSVLFIAPRREILFQARATIQRVHPDKSIGLLADGLAELDADILLATVDSLRNRLSDIESERFDYVVIDEFHHASATSYRKIINHLSPKFLLGLTATPLRTDGADLLGLCENNLVTEVDLVEGIRRGLLATFHYRGVADPVDFKPIPWRNGRFDPEQLEHALANEARAEAAFRAWSEVRGARALIFCASQRHADWTAEDLRRRGVKAVAVHSGPSSAPRAESLERLRTGDLEALVSVDMFNEGFDLPALDSVVMLRPTESPVVFLQQLGRGLRRSEGKTRLEVIDFVGNHRSFLNRPKLLLSLGSKTSPSDAELLKALRTNTWTLPEGCSVEYDVEAIDLISTLATSARVSGSERVKEFIRQYYEANGRRPTAAQAWQAGVNPGALRPATWLEGLAALGLLTANEEAVVEQTGGFLSEVERTSMTRSFKMVTLRALIEHGAIESVGWRELADWSLRIIRRDPRLHGDVSAREVGDIFEVDPARWQSYWRKNPIAAWIGEERPTSEAWFRLDGEFFTPNFGVDRGQKDVFFDLLDELVEFRLASYLARARGGADKMLLRVTHAGIGRPIIMLDRRNHPDIPEGPTVVKADGEDLEAHFVKVALNKVTVPNETKNVLPTLLLEWFGQDAGQPGNAHFVVLERSSGHWNLRPAENEAVSTVAG